jgi:hypothetical protein
MPSASWTGVPCVHRDSAEARWTKRCCAKSWKAAAGLPQLLDVTTGERQAIVDEMTQINQAKNASKVYHLFG